MEGRREDDFAAIAWPGFVDTLSSVIIMFIFFVLITATALYFHTITYKGKIKEKAMEEILSSMELDKNKQIRNVINELKEENKFLKEKITEHEKEKTNTAEKEFDQSKEKNVITGAWLDETTHRPTEISEDNLSITIFFDKSSITLPTETGEEIRQFITDHLDKFSSDQYVLEIRIGKMPKAPTEKVAREIALARMFNVRNELLKIKELPRTSIKAVFDEPKKINNNYYWGRLSIKKVK